MRKLHRLFIAAALVGCAAPSAPKLSLEAQFDWTPPTCPPPT
jgi:hypothetical protein